MKTLILIIIASFTLLGCSTVLSETSAEANPQLSPSEISPTKLNNDSAKIAPDVITSADAITAAMEENMIDNEGSVIVDLETVQESLDSDSRRPGRPLFNFNGSEPSWYTLDDNVMGGVSSSSVRIDPKLERLTFSGIVSLDNNGGFASTRSDWVGYDLSGYDGIVLRVLGDGNTYRFRIRTANTGPAVAYTALFETKADEWHKVYIPFVDMIPTYRGFVVSAAGAIDPSSIRSFGLMLSDKQQGEFLLAVDWINAVVVQNYEYSYVSLETNNQLPDSY